MRKLKLIVLLFIFSVVLKAQTPQGFSYQAVIRNSSGTPIASQSIKVHILLTNQLGTLTHYGEEHTLTTTPQGVANLTIGAGNSKVGTLATVPWQMGDVYIKVEVDPTGTGGYQPMGTPVKLNAVPYALFAENAKEVVSPVGAADTDPIFVVKNKVGQIVFAVYQTGVRAYVSDTSKVKGAKGGFAVGGLTSKSISDGQDYFSITPTSTRIWFNDKVKGAKGGFAIGGLTSKATNPTEYFSISPDSARIRLKDPVKGAKGGFAVGGLSSLGKGGSNNFLDLTPQNSFIGQDAGKSNTTGERNAFIGFQAGYTNSDGNDNIYIGNTSGLSNTSGSSNIFLGTASGKSNTSGSNNIFLGTNSGEQNTTGVSNISIGTGAGLSLLTGLKNIFIGVNAGYSNAAGLDNVFIGNFAGNANTSSSNVFIGRTSGLSNTTGTNNVFVGEQTGRLNIEGSGNVFLGDQAGISEMGSNKLYISNSSTTAPLIYGEFDKGRVEINGSVKLTDMLNLKPKTVYPGNPLEGDVLYDATSKKITYYNGTAWMELTATPKGLTTPLVSTVSIPPLTILASSCIVNGNISNQGGSPILESGVYYSIAPFFDIQSIQKVIFSTPGVGDFSVKLTPLSQRRLYYVRAYAKNTQGTSLGNMMTFTTPIVSAMPTITSNPVTNIAQTTAVAGGSVTLPGATALSTVGVCWSTTPNPTIANNVIPATVGLGSFTCNISGLTANTTYYVCAYATNSVGTAYGNQVIFNTASTITTVSDIENNVYNTVQIGTQTWMRENLKTTKYRDGSNITNITDDIAWKTQTTEAYCWYENNAAANKDIYGALYNYYAIVDSRNLCPTGWHVPNDNDWTDLTTYLGGDKVAAGRLKEAGALHWIDPIAGTDNSSGFTALPSGYRYDGAFNEIGYAGQWWSNTLYDNVYVSMIYMYSSSLAITMSADYKITGNSVRCLKDK